MLDFSPCLGFLGRKAAASRRLRMDEYKDCNQLLAKNENLLTRVNSRGKTPFRCFLDAIPVTQYTAQEPAWALQERRVESSD